METIYTIPVNEAFSAVKEDPALGCPLCRLYDKLEEDELDRILGAAMMEPDVRLKTNEEGFCHRHFGRMYKKKNRLGLALMLESHLPEIQKRLSGKGIGAIRGGASAESMRRLTKYENSCYLCNRIDMHLSHMRETVVYLFFADPGFRKNFAATPFFCLPHYKALLDTATKDLPKKNFAMFYETVSHLEETALDALKKDVSWFCKKFDYRYEEEPWYNAKDAVERAIALLSGTQKD